MASKSKSTGNSNPFIGALSCPLVEFYRAEGYTPDDSIGYLMRRIIALIAQGVERELEPTGLTNAQWVPLLKLYMGRASTVAELARQCDLDAGSMTRLLDRLEAKQLCRRVRSFRDEPLAHLQFRNIDDRRRPVSRLECEKIPHRRWTGTQNQIRLLLLLL